MASWVHLGNAAIQTRGHNFSPRLGLASAPGNRKTVLRAGFELYYDRIPLRAVANALRGAGIEYKQVTLQRGQAAPFGGLKKNLSLHPRRCGAPERA